MKQRGTMTKVQLCLFCLLLNNLVATCFGDFVNSFLNQKQFGPIPGPCEQTDSCVVEREDGGTIAIWELECDQLGIVDLDAPIISNDGQTIKAKITATDIVQNCEGKTEFTDVQFNLAGSIFTRVSGSGTFKTSQSGGAADANFELWFLAPSGSSFNDDLPDDVYFPLDQCNLDLNLAFELELNGGRLDELTVCLFGSSSGCFNIASLVGEDLVNRVLRSFDETFSEVICESLEGTTIIDPLTNEIGSLDEFLDYLNLEFNILKSGQPDDISLIENNIDNNVYSYIQSSDRLKSLNWRDDERVELFSLYWNDVLSQTDDQGRKFINSLIDQFTNDGTFVYNFVDNFVDVSYEFVSGISNLDVIIEAVEFQKMNTVQNFQLFKNNYDQAPATRNKYTPLHEFEIDELVSIFSVKVVLKRGTWVASSSCGFLGNYNPSCTSDRSSFTFKYRVDLVNARLTAATTLLMELEKVLKLQLGTLFDPYRDDISVDTFTDILQCLSTALYTFNFTSLQLDIDDITNLEIYDISDSQFGGFITEANILADALTKNAFIKELPNIMQGEVRRAVNDFIVDTIVNPQPCIPYNPTFLGPFVVFDEPNSFIVQVINAFNDRIGGNPITSETPNFNTIFQDLLEDYATRSDAFPFKKNINDGDWISKDAFQSDLRFDAFSPASAFANLGYPFQLLNTDEATKALVIAMDSFALDLSASFGPSDPLTVSVHFEFDDKSGIQEEFILELVIGNMDLSIELQDILIRSSNFLKLTVGQTPIISCLVAIVDNFILGHTLSISSLETTMYRITSNSGTSFFDAVSLLEGELNNFSPSSKFQTMFTTIVDNSISQVLKSIENVDRSLYTVQTCEEVDLAFPVADTVVGIEDPFNLSSILEECSHVPTNILTPAQADQQVVYDENADSYFDIGESNILKYISDRLTSDFLLNSSTLDVNDFIDDLLLETANDPDSFFSEYLNTYDDNGNLMVDLVFDLSQDTFVQSLFDSNFLFEDDRIIPGLSVQLETLKLSKINTVLRNFTFLSPRSRFVTNNRVTFVDTSPLVLELNGKFSYNAEFIGDTQSPTRKIEEEFDLTIDLSGLDIDMDLLTAIDIGSVGNLTLGHFVEVLSPQQTIQISDFAPSCIFATVFENGLSIPRLDVSVGAINVNPVTLDIGAQDSSNPSADRIFSLGVEQVLQAVLNLGFNFYVDAVPNLCQNCLRDYFNEKLKERVEEASNGGCPDIVPPKPGLLQPEDEILRFDSIPIMQQFQDAIDSLWKPDDGYSGLNSIIDDITQLDGGGRRTFFEDDPINLLNGARLNLNQVTYGRATLQILDFTYDNLATITNASLFEPDYTDATEYTTVTGLRATGPVTIAFAVNLYAYDIFKDDDLVENEVKLTITVPDIEIFFKLYAEVNITDALSIPINGAFGLNFGCLLRPTNDFRLLEYVFDLPSVVVKIECNGDCEFPLLAPLQIGSSETFEDGESLSNAIKDVADLVEEYVVSKDFQDYVAYFRENGEAICKNKNVIIPDGEAESENVLQFAQTLAYSFSVLVGICIVLFFAARPAHQKRQEYLLKESNLKKGDTKKYVKYAVAPLAFHPSTPAIITYGLPLIMILNVVALFYAFFFTGALDITFTFKFFGMDTNDIVIVPFTIVGTINRLNSSGFTLSALIMGYTAFGFPILVYLTLLALWFTPATLLSARRRYNVLVYMQSQEKWLFLPIFVFVLTLAALKTYVRNITYSQIRVLDSSFIQGDVNVVPQFGITLLCVVAFFAVLLTQMIALHHYRAQKYNQMQKGTRAFFSDQRKRPVIERMCTHKFESVPFQFNPKRVSAFIAVSAIGHLFLFIGIFLPLISFEVGGIVGDLLKALDDPLNVKVYTLLELADVIGTAGAVDFLELLTKTVVQSMFYVITLIIPIIITPCALYFFTQRFKLATRRILLSLLSAAWAICALEVFLLAMILSLFGVKSVAVQSVEFLSQTLCQVTRGLIKDSVTVDVDQANDVCFDLIARIEPDATLLIMGLLLQVWTIATLLVVTTIVLKDQEYIDSKRNEESSNPVRIGTIRQFILRQLADPVPLSPEDESVLLMDEDYEDQFQLKTVDVLGMMAANLRDSFSLVLRPRSSSHSDNRNSSSSGNSSFLARLLTGKKQTPKASVDESYDKSFATVQPNTPKSTVQSSKPKRTLYEGSLVARDRRNQSPMYSGQSNGSYRTPPSPLYKEPKRSNKSKASPDRPPPLARGLSEKSGLQRNKSNKSLASKSPQRPQRSKSNKSLASKSPQRPSRPTGAAIAKANAQAAMSSGRKVISRLSFVNPRLSQKVTKASKKQQEEPPQKTPNPVFNKNEKQTKRVSQKLDDWFQDGDKDFKL